MKMTHIKLKLLSSALLFSNLAYAESKEEIHLEASSMASSRLVYDDFEWNSEIRQLIREMKREANDKRFSLGGLELVEEVATNTAVVGLTLLVVGKKTKNTRLLNYGKIACLVAPFALFGSSYARGSIKNEIKTHQIQKTNLASALDILKTVMQSSDPTLELNPLDFRPIAEDMMTIGHKVLFDAAADDEPAETTSRFCKSFHGLVQKLIADGSLDIRPWVAEFKKKYALDLASFENICADKALHAWTEPVLKAAR